MFDEYIFSSHANYIRGAERQPEMVTRLLEGLLHPMIHVGFGVEFTLPGIFAEGNILGRTRSHFLTTQCRLRSDCSSQKRIQQGSSVAMV